MHSKLVHSDQAHCLAFLCCRQRKQRHEKMGNNLHRVWKKMSFPRKFCGLWGDGKGYALAVSSPIGTFRLMLKRPNSPSCSRTKKYTHSACKPISLKMSYIKTHYWARCWDVFVSFPVRVFFGTFLLHSARSWKTLFYPLTPNGGSGQPRLQLFEQNRGKTAHL